MYVYKRNTLKLIRRLKIWRFINIYQAEDGEAIHKEELQTAYMRRYSTSNKNKKMN